MFCKRNVNVLHSERNEIFHERFLFLKKTIFLQIVCRNAYQHKKHITNTSIN